MINFGDVPTWVAAIGTVGTLIFALAQIRSERDRRIKQEKADREERKKAQARLISGWVGEFDHSYGERGRTAIMLSNGSAEPVYRVYAAIVFIQGAAPHTGEEWHTIEKQGGFAAQSQATTTASILPPGTWRVWVPNANWGILGGRIGAEVAFTDRASVHWVRRATGALEELSILPFDHFGLIGPYELVTPEPVEVAPSRMPES